MFQILWCVSAFDAPLDEAIRSAGGVALAVDALQSRCERTLLCNPNKLLKIIFYIFHSSVLDACNTIWNLAGSANSIVMSDMIQSGVVAGLCRMCRGKKTLQSAAVGALWNFTATHAKLVLLTDGCDGLWRCALAGVDHADAALKNICACCPQRLNDVIGSGIAALSRLSGSRAKHDDATLAVRRQVVLDLLK